LDEFKYRFRDVENRRMQIFGFTIEDGYLVCIFYIYRYTIQL